MKKSLFLLTALGTFALMACSSLDVSDAESTKENYPDDFSASEYVALHPGLRSLQIQDYVKEHNSALSLEKDVVAADTAAFLADTATLHQIFVDPDYAGYTEDFWKEEWAVLITTTTVCDTVFQFDTISVRVQDLTNSAVTKVYLGELSYAADGSISEVTGFTDSLHSAASAVSFEIGESYAVVNKANSMRIDTTKIVDNASCRDEQDSIFGGLSAATKRQLLKFNFEDSVDDLNLLAQVPVDSEAFSLQFLAYGKAHGWAYRMCRDDELNNPTQTETYPMVKLYCTDGEVVHEIAE